MTATARLDASPTDSVGLGPVARSGDRSALAELGRRGGRARAERAAKRRAEAAASILLGTVQQMRAFLEARAGEVAVSGEAASVKANAAARVVSALTELDGLAELARENQRLGMENASLKAQLAAVGGARGGIAELARTLRGSMGVATDDDDATRSVPLGDAPAEGEGGQ